MSAPTKLPPVPRVGPTVEQRTLPPSGDYTISGENDKTIRFAATTSACRVLISGCRNVEIDLSQVISEGAWNAIKLTGGNQDCIIRTPLVASAKSVGILSVGGNQRVWWRNVTIGPCGEGDNVSPPEQRHSMYLGSQGEDLEHVVEVNHLGPQKYGYGIQLYEKAMRCIITGTSKPGIVETPGYTGARSDVGIGILVGGASDDNLLVNIVGVNNRAGLAAGGAGAQQGALTVKNCGQVGGGSYPDGQPGAITGTWTQLTKPSDLVIDPAFVINWGGTTPPDPPVDPCAAVKADLALCNQTLVETAGALIAATDTIEKAREHCRAQITGWRTGPVKTQQSWVWIKKQPVWKAFLELGGS